MRDGSRVTTSPARQKPFNDDGLYQQGDAAAGSDDIPFFKVETRNYSNFSSSSSGMDEL